MHQHPLFLCLAHNYKGQILLDEARQLGVRTLLIAKESSRGQWPSDCADEVFYFPSFSRREQLCQAVAYLARDRRFEAVFPLDELSVEVAAVLREHLGLEGLDLSQAHRFRDKLLMRLAAERAGIPQPRFVAVLNDLSVQQFTAQVPAPWYLKPRSLAGSAGILRIESSEELACRLADLGDQRGFYLLEESIEGPVYHVDSLVYGHQVSFAQVHAYGESPWRISHQGGVFSTCTVDARDPANAILRTLNERVVGALELARGVAHAEFLERDGHFYFLEAAARVGGANIDVLVEKTSGVNLWREWLKMELCALRGTGYRNPSVKSQYGGMLTCLSRHPRPDLSDFEAPELAWKLDKLHHAGLVLTSPDFQRLQRCMRECKARMEERFLAVLPPRPVGAIPS